MTTRNRDNSKATKSSKLSGGFIKLPRHLESQPEIARLLNEKGAAGFGLFFSINLYLANCEGGWGSYTGRQLSSIATSCKKHRSDVKSIIDDYGLFIVEGDRFTSLWMQNQFANASSKTAHSRANILRRTEEIDKEVEKNNKEKGIVRISDDTHMPSEGSDGLPLAPSADDIDTNNYQDYSHYLKR